MSTVNLPNDSKLNSNDFKLVCYKRRGTKLKPKSIHQNPILQCADLPFVKEASIRRILEAKLELSTTDLFDSVNASLQEGLSSLENPILSEIICLGLGKIGECTIARYQFALLLCLKELYKVDVCVYDPIFKEDDQTILNHFNIKVLKDNLEGKYKIQDKKTTVFYLPHCPSQLSNNLLWANWGLDLNYCVIIANSFNKIIESCSTKTLKENSEYILKISPYVLELAVINSFKFYEVFNDTAIHVFPKLNLIAPDLWEFCPEPKYSDEDTEFVTNTLNKLLI
ncbi:hypothetical protein NQ314_019053 [Rhamnusium bicolor]|uniref:SRR1-like domain-containing protein n=1 Tax=Rhamnusium bicolor TaxID=1586634 RepID=A0AAV8WPD5_9CUCU|nr:hypothetical protein NQ314_019053 [Rhamnusium bicolor]